MQYRLGLVADYPAITDFVNSQEYFMPVDPSTLGGVWLLAEQDGIVRGTIWFAAGMGHAYVDYWSATSARVAARLGAYAQEVMAGMGVKHVRAVIGETNAAAQRLAGGLGMALSHSYQLAYKRV